MTNSELEAENVRLRAALSDCNRGLNEMAGKIVAVGTLLGFMPDEDVREIVEKVRTLCEDKARLDWLENNSADAYEVHGAWHIYPDRGLASPGLRLAIDEARRKPSSK